METLTYSRSGEYLIPDLTLQPQAGEARTLGRYARMRREYLQDHRPILYNSLLLKEKLYPHLWEIDRVAAKRLEQVMDELTAQTPPPDRAASPQAWASHMNSLKQRAEALVLAELVNS